jgi:integrase
MAALRLLLLTGCRVGEILALRWKDVDLDRRLLLLPDSKTGAKSVFLSQPAIDLLHSLDPKHGSEEYVFPGEQPGRPVVSIRKPWIRACGMAKINGVRLHDLRHSFASIGAGSGLSLPVIGALLGHSQPTTTARYAHLAASPLHQAVEVIGAQISTALSERDKKTLTVGNAEKQRF